MKKGKGSSVKCRVCTNEQHSFCNAKNVGIHPNKSRKCGSFEYDATKVKIKQKLPATYVKGGDMKAYREAAIEAYEQQASGARIEEAKNPDVLSKFRSTAE